MNGLKIEIDREFISDLQRVEKQFPWLVRKANGRAAEGARKQFSSILKNGGLPKARVPKFEKHNSLTTEIHGKHKIFDGDTIRAATDTRLHAKWVSGGVQHIGWPSKLDKWMSREQDAERRQMTDVERCYMHRRGVEYAPGYYICPERNVVDNWAGYLSRGVYASWIAGALNKMLERMLARRAK